MKLLILSFSCSYFSEVGIVPGVSLTVCDALTVLYDRSQFRAVPHKVEAVFCDKSFRRVSFIFST